MSMAGCPESSRGGLALVLTGGGARAAYQAGFLRRLVQRIPAVRFPIITGVSAGAINAAFLAAHPGTLVEATEELARLWRRLEPQEIFRIDGRWLVCNALRWMWRLSTGGSAIAPQVRGMLDTGPLRRLLCRMLGARDGTITGVRHNVAAGRLKALALLTVDYSTGRTVTWVEGCEIQEWERPNRSSRATELTVAHVMASAALPLVFPAVELEDAWYGDGGIRLAAPLAPAIHLGAERILAISSAHGKRRASACNAYPPPAQIAGNLLNAIFLDVLEYDAHQAERINDLVRRLPAGERRGLHEVQLRLVRPSLDLGRVSAEYEPQLPRVFRFMTRGLGTRETSSPDFLSLLMFQPDYLTRLVDVGEADADAQADQIAALVEES